MIHGVTLEKGPQDWQILQQEAGRATLRLAGTWRLHPDAVNVGVAEVHPMVRLLREEDGYPVIPWGCAESKPDADGRRGEWSMLLDIPAGGLYRLETGLDTISIRPGLAWVFRGDIRMHIGVGDVFVVAGQSNAAGYGRDNGYDPPDLRVHLLRNRGTWDLASHPMNEATGVADLTDCDRGICGSSPYLSFGKRFSDVSHCPVGLVATALGGMPLRRWDTRADGSLFWQMLEKIRRCGAKPAGILWYQGCSDTSDEDAPAYSQRFALFVAELRRELGYDVPVFTFQLNRELTPGNDAGYAAVREAQRMAAHTIPGVYVLPTLDCDLSDGIHNTCHGNQRLGERLARQCAGVLCGAPPLKAPDIACAAAQGANLTLRFQNLVGALTLRTGDVNVCGLTVTDAGGGIAVTALRTDPAQPDTLLVTLARAPQEEAAVSYLWQANPLACLALDNATFLPPLAFYRVPIAR